MPLDPYAGRLLRMLTATGEGGAKSAEDRRRSLNNLAEIAGGSAPQLARIEDMTIPGGEGPIPARRYAGASTQGRMMFFHGGGWVAGGLDTHDAVCRRLAASGELDVIAVDYRLAPEHPYPAGLEDVVAAIRWAAMQKGALVIAGDSAGANLAAAACMLMGEGEKPDLLLLLCPILDLAEESASRQAFSDGYFLSRHAMSRDLEDYLPKGGDLYDPRLSPLHAADLSTLPPTHLHVAEFDPFRDEGLAFGEKLQASGVKVSVTQHLGMIHYFYALAGAIPSSAGAIDKIGFDVALALHSRT